jgi:rhamnose utilization protein RhaD (predicted bifunctional aldolase and dehydrogenase)
MTTKDKLLQIAREVEATEPHVAVCLFTLAAAIASGETSALAKINADYAARWIASVENNRRN